jgi:hypothetical protein
MSHFNFLIYCLILMHFFLQHDLQNGLLMGPVSLTVLVTT